MNTHLQNWLAWRRIFGGMIIFAIVMAWIWMLYTPDYTQSIMMLQVATLMKFLWGAVNIVFGIMLVMNMRSFFAILLVISVDFLFYMTNPFPIHFPDTMFIWKYLTEWIILLLCPVVPLYELIFYRANTEIVR